MNIESEKTGSVGNIPYLIKAFIFCYLGWYGFMSFTGDIVRENILQHVLWGIWVSICLAVFSYGVICLIMDFRKGKIGGVIDRLKKFKNGNF